jgi:hypothetical protein
MLRSSRAGAAGRLEALIGRTLAASVHPLGAWHVPTRSYRLLLVAAYFALSYISTLATMLVLE